MENNKFKKVIATKKVDDIEYRLVHRVNNNLFIIYKFDTKIKSIHRIPEIFRSRNEKDARKYLEEIK